MKLPVLIKWRVLRTRLYLESLRLRAFYLPAIIFLLTTFTTVNAYHLYRFSGVWNTFESAGGNAFKFCETNRMNEIIRQPANTWSNFGYLAVGLFALTLAVHDYKNKSRRQSANFLVQYPMFSLLYGLSCLYLFIGSFLFHASLTEYFQRLDQSGLLSVVIMLLALNFYKLAPYFRKKGEWKNLHAVAMIAAVVCNVLIFRWLLSIDINVLFPVLLLMVIASGLFYTFKIRNRSFFLNYMYAAFLLMFLAGGIWILDRSHTLCNPDSMLQGHALWHLLTAVSMFFIYLYYRSGSLSDKELAEAGI